MSKMMALGLIALMSGSVFANEDLALKESIDLFKCIRKNVRKSSFDEKKNDLTHIVGSVLNEEGRLTTNTELLKHATLACKNDEDTNIFILNNTQLENAERIIKDMKSPYYGCDYAALDAAVAVGVGLGVGGAVYKCHGSDASVRLYVGPRISYGLGIGAFIVGDITSDRGMYEQPLPYQEKLEVENAIAQVNFSGDAIIGLGIAQSGSYTGEGYGVGLGLMYRDRLDATLRVGSLPSDWKNFVRRLR